VGRGTHRAFHEIRNGPRMPGHDGAGIGVAVLLQTGAGLGAVCGDPSLAGVWQRPGTDGDLTSRGDPGGSLPGSERILAGRGTVKISGGFAAGMMKGVGWALGFAGFAQELIKFQ